MGEDLRMAGFAPSTAWRALAARAYLLLPLEDVVQLASHAADIAVVIRYWYDGN
jgi:hypothetical protein